MSHTGGQHTPKGSQPAAEKRTPGPWLIAPGQFIVADCIGGDPSTGKIVAEVPCQGANPADLFVIAAAPALLEALEALVLWHERGELKAVNVAMGRVLAVERSFEVARAALAQARGGNGS